MPFEVLENVRIVRSATSFWWFALVPHEKWFLVFLYKFNKLQPWRHHCQSNISVQDSMFQTHTFIILLRSNSLNSRNPNLMLNMQETRAMINKYMYTNNSLVRRTPLLRLTSCILGATTGLGKFTNLAQRKIEFCSSRNFSCGKIKWRNTNWTCCSPRCPKQ